MMCWVPATIDPNIPGWYECRYYEGDIPQLLYFDGYLWRHEPDGDTTLFGNTCDEDDEGEAWRVADQPGE